MAAMSIAVASENRCNRFIINDINAPLVSLLQDAIENPETLYKRYSDIWEQQFSYPDGSERHFYHIRDLLIME